MEKRSAHLDTVLEASRVLAVRPEAVFTVRARPARAKAALKRPHSRRSAHSDKRRAVAERLECVRLTAALARTKRAE